MPIIFVKYMTGHRPDTCFGVGLALQNRKGGRQMRLMMLAVFAVAAATQAVAQQNSIAAPDPGIANYDATLSAKEAVLANWEFASAGIRAGRIVGGKVVDLGDSGATYAIVYRQAKFAQKTMVQRFNAAHWIYTAGSGVTETADATALTDAVKLVETPCEADDCDMARNDLIAAFAHATAELDVAAKTANAALKARENRADVALMSEQLSLMADYLESRAWAESFALSQFGRDGEEVAARIVGVMSLWRNIEPYVGLLSPEIDDAINSNATTLLRTLRRETRTPGAVQPDGPEMTAIATAADALSAEFRRAAALFSS